MFNIYKNQKGQSLVEFALLLPVLILILLCIMEGGRIFSTHLILQTAAREGARSAALGMDNSQIITKVENFTGTLDLAKLTITINPEDIADRTTGQEASIKLEYNLDIITPIISNILGDPFPLKTKVAMRVE